MQIKESMYIRSGILILLLMLTTGICYADFVNVEIIGQFSGDVLTVTVADNYAYAGVGQDLVILDINDVSNPSETGRVTTPSEVYAIAIADDYAFIANGDEGITIADISNPASPIILGNFDTDGFARDIAVSGNYAYVADVSGLVIVDVSVPSSPSLVGTYDTTGFANCVTVSDNYAYVADDGKGIFDGSNGLVIIDISNPASPTLVSIYDNAYTYASAISGNYAYLATSEGLVILNISDLSLPIMESSYTTSGDSNGIAVSDNLAYLADGNGLVIFDVSTPSSPKYIGSYDGTYAYAVDVAGDYVYVADSINGLLVVKIIDSSAPGSDDNSTGNETDKPPVISGIGDKSVRVNELLTFRVSAIDDEGDVIVYSAQGLPEGATIDENTGIFRWTPDTEGSYVVTFLAESNGQIDSETITIVVLPSTVPSSEPQISNLSAENISSSSVTLTWTNSPDVAFVELHRNDIFIENISASVSTYTDQGLVNDTSYTYSLLPYLSSGTKGNITSITLTTSSSSNNENTDIGEGGSTGSSSSSGTKTSSSGGGGAGAGSTEDFSNIELKEVDSKYLGLNANVSYKFTKEGNPIQSVSFYSLKNSGEITTTIEVLHNRSKLVSTDPEGLVYKYVNIWVGKSGFATESNIKEAHVQFKLNSSWLEQIGVNPSGVRLQRYNGAVWEILPTQLMGNNTNYFIFEAQTPGFSPFAITADKRFEAPVNSTDIPLQSAKSGFQTDIVPTDINSGQTQPEKSNLWVTLLAVLVIGLLIVGYIYMKKK